MQCINIPLNADLVKPSVHFLGIVGVQLAIITGEALRRSMVASKKRYLHFCEYLSIDPQNYRTMCVESIYDGLKTCSLETRVISQSLPA